MAAWPRDTTSSPIDPVQLHLLYLVIALDCGGGDEARRMEDAAAATAVRTVFQDMLARYLKNRWGRLRVSSTI